MIKDIRLVIIEARMGGLALASVLSPLTIQASILFGSSMVLRMTLGPRSYSAVTISSHSSLKELERSTFPARRYQ